jgi:hypothetical protein
VRKRSFVARHPAKHSHHLQLKISALNSFDHRGYHVLPNQLLESEVALRRGCHLRQVCDAKDLATSGKGLKSSPHRLGCNAANSRIDLVEDEKIPGLVTPLFSRHRQKGKQDPTHLATRRHIANRGWWQSGISRNPELDDVGSSRTRCCRLIDCDLKDRPFQSQLSQLCLHCRRKTPRRLKASRAEVQAESLLLASQPSKVCHSPLDSTVEVVKLSQACFRRRSM